jgi:hypothetical protein
METTTHGIEYPDGTDPITDYPAVAANAAATIDSLIAGGWIPLGAVLTFGAIDGHTFTATAPADLTARYGRGLACSRRLDKWQATAVVLAIIAAVTVLAALGQIDGETSRPGSSRSGRSCSAPERTRTASGRAPRRPADPPAAE